MSTVTTAVRSLGCAAVGLLIGASALATPEDDHLKGVQSYARGDVVGAMAALRAPVDAFFDQVTVNCAKAEMRANRLRLLSQIRSAPEGVADFSQIEG